MPAPRTAASRPISKLDPRAPFVVDTHELGRRAGSMLRWTRSVPAPATWRVPMAEVPADAPVTLDLRLESVVEGVLVSGTAQVDVVGECGRCLDPLRSTVTAEVQELFGYEPDPEDKDAPVLSGGLLDLEPLVRDAVVLAIPLNPVCTDGCAGLCPACGARLADAGDDHRHDDTDPRWAALSGLRLEATPGTGPDGAHRRDEMEN